MNNSMQIIFTIIITIILTIARRNKNCQNRPALVSSTSPVSAHPHNPSGWWTTQCKLFWLSSSPPVLSWLISSSQYCQSCIIILNGQEERVGERWAPDAFALSFSPDTKFRTLLWLLFGIVAIVVIITTALPFSPDMKKGWDRGDWHEG